MSTVIIEALDRRYAACASFLGRYARRTLTFLKRNGVTLYVYVAPDKILQELNAAYRGKRDPTDVLSFPAVRGFPHPEHRGALLGEVYLAPAYSARRWGAGRDAGCQTRESRERMLRLLIHGIAHLCHYNHERERDRIRMERVERRCFKECVSARRRGRTIKSHRA